MVEIKDMVEEIQALSDGIMAECDVLDENDMGVSNYYPDKSTADMCKLCLNMFNIYIANADSEIDDKELELIDELLQTPLSRSDVKVLIEKSGLDKGDFAEQLPVIFRTFIDADNYEDKSAGRCPLSVTLYDLFAKSGVYMIAVNEQVEPEEYKRLEKYLTTIYNFIKQNLKYGYSDIKKPQAAITRVLDEIDMKIDPKLLKKTKKKSDSDDSKEPNVDGEEEQTLEELIEELNSMIGLDEVKYEVTSLMNLFRVKMLRENMGLEMPPVSMHLVFSGNPGTGKTTVARLLAKIYKKIGVLSKGQLVEVDRSGLVGGYVGQTALKVKDVVDSAIGGVLFIDEAYSLTPENSPNDYGLEAVDTLVKAMEDNRQDLIVIVAGYPELMKRFLSSNPGLKSRFNKFIYFRDYTPDELTQIFNRFCSKSGYRASLPAVEYVHDFFTKRCEEKEENFANAREVRNLFEFAIGRQANRIMIVANPTKETLSLLKASDVSGEDVNLGKQQYLAQKAIDELIRERRHGLEIEKLAINIDELELSAGAEEMLFRNQIFTIKDFVDAVDAGKNVDSLDGATEENAEEILQTMKAVGYVE